eukprot:COSAG02_NODE_49139_length_328_cov_6.187773_2_plen_41_part_01
MCCGVCRTNVAKRLDSVAGLCALDCVLLCVWYVCGFRAALA